MRTHVDVLAVVVATAVAVVAVACDDDSGGDTSGSVSQLVKQSFPELAVSADCPGAKSAKFDCTVTVGSQDVTVPVEDVDGTVELRAAVVNLGDVERRIEGRYFREQGVAASAECGPDPRDAALVEHVGATFTCTIEPSGGQATETTVTVTNLDGDVSFEL